MANRFVKMHPHLLFNEYEVSVYVDGNVQVLSDVGSFARSAMERGDLALFEHPFRKCIYAEAQECSAIGHEWFWKINRQMRRYRKEGYPAGYGLYEANVIVRRHGSAAVRRLMEAWWAEYVAGVRRDQLSLGYLAWKMRVPIVSLGPSEVRAEGLHFALREGHARPSPWATRARGWLYRRARGLWPIQPTAVS